MRCLAAFAALCALSLAGCRTTGTPMDTVEHVDLDRFMGKWYVIANIPTFLERDAYNAVETYQLAGEGQVNTIFTFRKGGFDGVEKTLNPTGFVVDGTGNAVWEMQFLWPFRAEYLVAYLDPEYERTIIGRSRRDYVWLMAREPAMEPRTYQRMLEVIEAIGYDTSRIRRVPQQWPEAPGSPD